jgi:molybdopterin synthase sulfur carrier subunit
MDVNIIFFGQMKDISGSANLVMQDVGDTENLMALLVNKYPAISNTPFVLAVDKEIVKKNTPLHHNSTVALMPAFSGG